MKKNRTLTITILVVLGLLLVISVWVNIRNVIAEVTPAAPAPVGKSGTARPIAVTVSVVRSEQVLDGVRAMGTFVANEQVDLASEISGKVTAIYIKEGQSVEKGEVLLRINDDDLQAQMNRYEFQLKTLAEKLERQRVLLRSEAVSQEAFDAVQTEYNVLQADMNILRVKIERSSIKAPFAGVVGFRYVSDGAYIQPGSQIAQLVDFSKLRVEFAIPEKYISMPLVGQKIYFTTEGSDRQNRATIYAMEPLVNDATRTIVLRAMFDNAAGRLRPGMSTRVTIPTAAVGERMLIPTEAVVPSMEGKSVWVVKNGSPSSVSIETGVRLEKDVEILSGLSLGDTIIVNGIMQMREGAALDIKN